MYYDSAWSVGVTGGIKMQIMTILGSALDEDSLVGASDGMARYAIADDVSRRYILPEVKEWLNYSFDCSTAICDLYISRVCGQKVGHQNLMYPGSFARRNKDCIL